MSTEKKIELTPAQLREREKRREERRQYEAWRETEKIELRREILKQTHALEQAMLTMKLLPVQAEELAKAALKMFFVIGRLSDCRMFEDLFERIFRLKESLYNETRLYEALGKEDARTVLALFEQFNSVLLAAQPTIAKYTKSRGADDYFRTPQWEFDNAMKH